MSQGVQGESAASPVPEFADVTPAELFVSIKAGIHDFRRAPPVRIPVQRRLCRCWMAACLARRRHFFWTLAFALGFPLVAPLAAVGIHETSRRIEADVPLEWAGILTVVGKERGRQLPWVGAILAFMFLFWSVFAHMSFALTAVSLPLLVDKKIDFVTAMLISVRTVARNKLVMCIWAMIVGDSLLVAILPLFLGPRVALPILGHATWHPYRRALYAPLT